MNSEAIAKAGWQMQEAADKMQRAAEQMAAALEAHAVRQAQYLETLETENRRHEAAMAWMVRQ